MPTRLKASQIVEDTLEDKDGNTKVSVESSANEDKIRFTTAGTERMIIANDGKVGINTSTPISELDIAGKVAITAEVSTPNQPADGQGYLYTKSDGKIYWRSHDLNETDLTAGGSGGTPAGTNKQIQFNNNGSFGAFSDFVWSSNQLGVGTSSPSSHIDVSGESARIRLNANPNSYPSVDFAENGTRKWIVYNNASNDNLVFKTNTDIRMSLTPTGHLGVGTLNPSNTLFVQGNLDGSHVAVIDNDENTNGHVLKLATDGNGSGSHILDMENGDGDIVFKARADGRFGFGPAGVSSMGAGTFVVGIDNSSHTADIAISKRLQHLGDSDTYMDFPSNDNITFAVGGSEELKIASDGILVKNIIKHDGDEDTRITFNDNQIILKAGNIALVTAEKNSSAPHEVTINDGSNNVDFVVKGNGSNQGNPGMKFDASTNKLGINGVGTPEHELHVDGTGKFTTSIQTSLIEYTDGDDAITISDGGYLKFNAGIKYARGVLVSSVSSPSSPDGGWIKFATFSCPGTSGLDTAASSFLITIAGMESSNNRVLDGTFMVHAKFTNNNTGSGTDGGSVSNAYYEPEGTYLYCEPLNAERMSAVGVNDFDPATDLLMIFPNNTSTPDVDLYIKACAKQKRCFATHLGGTGQIDTSDTDIGFTINTGQSWLTTEPAAPANNVKITGTWASKIFSKITAYNGVETTSVSVQVRDVNSTSTVLDTDYVLRCIQNQAITITLPPKSVSRGRTLQFKDILGNANTNNITIDGDSSDTIDGNATYVINHNKEGVTLVCDGINGWMVMNRIRP